VPQNPGGFADATGRQLADHFTRSFGQPAVVENKPGGNSMIGTAFVARAAPDGYTVLIGVPSLSLFNAVLKAPENTPLQVRRRLSAAVAAFGKDPAVAERFKTAGGIPYTSTPEEFTRFINEENRIWIDVARRAGVEKQ
jgi:tripartite-type tricarboxylate transporter receptor subunit TctC